MRAGQILLALALPLEASAYLDRQSALLLSLPQLRSPLQRHLAAGPNAGAAYRHLAEAGGAFPAIVDEHEFIGATSLGFVVYNTSSVRKGTTVVTDDYLSLLSTATLACAPRAAVDPRERAGQGRVTMTIAFPKGASDAEALEHLARRLALPSAVLALGVDTLLTHPDLGAEGSCVAHAAPDAVPLFLVDALARDGASLAMELSPATHQHAYDFQAMHLELSPNTEAEVARRLSAGLYAGRQLGVPDGALRVSTPAGAAWDLNVGATAGTAARPRIEFFSNDNAQPTTVSAIGSRGILYCSNCFYSASSVTLTVDLKACGIISGSALQDSVTQYYDLTSGNIQASSTYSLVAGASSLYRDIKIGTALKGLTDCSALGTSDPLTSQGSNGNFNGGFSATATLTSNANFNFNVQSSGQITTNRYMPAGTTLMSPAVAPSLACIQTSLSCVGPAVAALPYALSPQTGNPAAPATLVSPFSPVSDTTVTFGSVPIRLSVTMSLIGTAKVDANANLNLRMGVAGTTAHKMVGTMATPDFNVGSTSISSSYTEQSPPQIRALPLGVLSSSATGGVTDVTITAQFTLSLAYSLKFIFTHNFNLISTVGTGSSSVGVDPSSRALREGRALQQTCPAGTATFSPTATVSAGIFATPISVGQTEPAPGSVVFSSLLGMYSPFGLSAASPTYISPLGVVSTNYGSSSYQIIAPLVTLMSPAAQNVQNGLTPIPLPSGCTGSLLLSTPLAVVGSAADGAPAGAACSAAVPCASGACSGGFCCSATAAQMGCRSCHYGTGTCVLHSPGEACASSFDCGTNLCLGGCCCAASAALSVGCSACQCWGGSGSANATRGATAAAAPATTAATAGTCTANPSMTLTLPCNASESIPSAAALSRVISFGNLSVGADPLLLLPAVAPLNTWGADVILASAPACATFAAQQAGGAQACSTAQQVYVSAAGVPYYYLGSASALAMVATPGCSA